MENHSLPKALETFTHQFAIRIFVDHNRKGWQMPMEWHTFAEIFFVLEGHGRFFIGERIYTFKPGDLFVISDRDLHKSQVTDAAGFSALLVMFAPGKIFPGGLPAGQSPLDIFYRRAANFSHQLCPDDATIETYRKITSLMLTEYELDGQNSQAALTGLLNWLLTDLARRYSTHTAGTQYIPAGRRQHKKIVSDVLDYINTHYSQDISLSELAAKLYVNQSYLSREFKKSTGYSLVKFIASKRIREARELLQNTSLSVANIATNVGYNNITHFHFVFKNETGITPKTFRRQTQERGHI